MSHINYCLLRKESDDFGEKIILPDTTSGVAAAADARLDPQYMPWETA